MGAMGDPHDRQALCQSPHSFVAIGTKALPTHRAVQRSIHCLAVLSPPPKMPENTAFHDDGYRAPGIVAL